MKQPTTTPTPTTASVSARRGILVAALVIFTLINIARVVEIQQSFIISGLTQSDEALASSIEDAAAKTNTAASIEVVTANNSEPVASPVSRSPRARQSRAPLGGRLRTPASLELRTPPPTVVGCNRLDKSHVDPDFYQPSACYTRDQVLSIIKDLVFTAADAFTAHNVTYFMDSGTLLGAFREKKVIPHDVDADFGIDHNGLKYLQQYPIGFPDEYFFTVWQSALYPDSKRDDKLPARLIHRASGLYLDVFAFLDWDGNKVGPLPSWCFMNCAKCPTVRSGGRELKVPRDWIYPLAECEFEGRQLKCPGQTETYLKYTFGSGFMKPVKYTY